MKARYWSVAIVLLLINYLIFATLFTRLMSRSFSGSDSSSQVVLPTFTPAPAEPNMVIATFTPTIPTPTPTNTKVVMEDSPTDIPMLFTINEAYIYTGPGVEHDVIGQLDANMRLSLIGRNADNSWWQVTLNDTATGWLWHEDTQVNQAEQVPIVP